MSYKIIQTIYLALLGFTIGASLLAGVVGAPVVFNANDYIHGTMLTHFQMGELMSEIFRRLSYLVTFTATAIFLFEGYNLYKKEKCKLYYIFGAIAISTALAFSFYFIPTILELQLQGQNVTNSELFISTHKNSELIFKVFTFSSLALFTLRLFRAQK
jgi:hypothetical protein